jgi:esterase/lipase superfamily enzyme
LLYTSDEATAGGYSTEDIVQLLKQIRLTGAERIHMIAHSMGNRLIIDALQTLVDQGFNKDFLYNQVILAAPDIDAEVFKAYRTYDC